MAFQKEVGELLIDISQFILKINPNPMVAISALSIFNNFILNHYIFGIEVEKAKISTREVSEFYDHLVIFFKEFELYNYPDVAIAAFEITKNNFIQELISLGKGKKK